MLPGGSAYALPIKNEKSFTKFIHHLSPFRVDMHSYTWYYTKKVPLQVFYCELFGSSLSSSFKKHVWMCTSEFIFEFIPSLNNMLRKIQEKSLHHIFVMSSECYEGFFE